MRNASNRFRLIATALSALALLTAVAIVSAMVLPSLTGTADVAQESRSSFGIEPGESATEVVPDPAPAPAPAPVQPAPAPEQAPEVISAAEWALTNYGSFDPIRHSGSGDSVVTLPEGVDAAMVTVSHDGAASFVVKGLDASEQPTMDLLVNTTGAYSGTVAYGLSGDVGGQAVMLAITADGNWTIDVAPLGSAEEFAGSGSGDAVFLYSGASTSLALHHDGAKNFIVFQHTGVAFPFALLVNAVGEYVGTVPLAPGPSVVTVNADGLWTVFRE